MLLGKTATNPLPIPSVDERTFKGRLFFIFEWEKLMNDYEKEFRIEDMKDKSIGQKTWREFVKRFGKEGYLWLCSNANGGEIYIPEIDTQLRAARLRVYQTKFSMTR